MDPEIKAKWVAALRSGEYKQGQNFLNKGDQFCCLGVLCDITKEETGGYWQDSGMIGGVFSFVYQNSADARRLPQNLSQRLGLYGSLITTDEGGMTFEALNDGIKSRSYTFLEIADAIEEQL